MTKQIIFFHGGGSEEDYHADAKMVDSLKTRLGSEYAIHYPLLANNGSPDFGRRKQITDEISRSKDDVILVGHSLGASMLLACLSENHVQRNIGGIFLTSTPYWQGDEDWVKPFKLRSNFAQRLAENTPLFFYHCRDDEEVPFDHMLIYKKEVPWATFREIPTGGHQLNNDLSLVANDIKSL
jgi:uncharacterized protein